MAIDWTKLPSLTALRAFDSVARSKSFSEAARSLNVTHAAIAQQVRALEEHLGMKLVERSPRGVSLTPAGKELAFALANAFSAIAEAIDALDEKRRKRPVRVTTTVYFAETFIFPKIADFWSKHPGVEVSFTPSDETVDLVAENYDLGIRVGDGDWPGLKSQLLTESPTRAFASPTLVDDPATNWGEVPWLIPAGECWEREALSQAGINAAKIHSIDMGGPALEVRAAEEGIGLSLKPEFLIHTNSDSLETIMTDCQ